MLKGSTGAVLKDLEFPDCIDPILISEELGIEKPASAIFQRALDAVNAHTEAPIAADECLHVGDELIWWGSEYYLQASANFRSDYRGARDAGMNAALLRREGLAGEQERKEEGEELDRVRVIHTLDEICKMARN